MRPIWEKGGLFPFYIPPLFSSSEHCGDAVVYYERKMAQTTGLCHCGIALLCHGQGVGRYRNTTKY